MCCYRSSDLRFCKFGSFYNRIITDPINQRKLNKMNSVAERAYEHLKDLREESARYEKECLAELQLLEEKMQLVEELQRQKREKLDAFPSHIVLNVGGGDKQHSQEEEDRSDRDCLDDGRKFDHEMSRDGRSDDGTEEGDEEERKDAGEKEAEEYIEELRDTVKLDVRGKRYVTTKKTLQRGGEGSMLSVLASGRWTAETAEGYKIDRDSRCFAMVLEYLRTGRREIGKRVAYFGIDMSAVKRRCQWSRRTWTQDARCTSTFTDQTLYKSTVYSVTALSNGLIASGHWDNIVKIWTLDGTCTATLSGHKAPVWSVAGLSNGQVASGSQDKTMKIWTLDGTCTATFSGHTSTVSSVTELSDGHVATGSWDKTVKIWTLDSTCTATLSGHKDAVCSVKGLSNGQIASGSRDNTVRIWSIDGTCTATLSGHTAPVWSVTELSNGHIATGSKDGTVKIWTLDGTPISTFSGHSNFVCSVIELSNSQIASGSEDGTVKIWNLDGTCTTTLYDHNGCVWSVTELTNGCIASGSKDAQLQSLREVLAGNDKNDTTEEESVLLKRV
ncbi:hypothetical protein PROFUN_09054 [Planoprotostelium fungivorum]|uniref:Potassium channel tetramerisation-type BTB domain-containing protein n=1 Tax=Planoprotostelium fungivorum TaxID=1890364 RepID=A0A2P6NIG0_9EUKA|nr:hypothetical protein PROFUN_09054 [Planoprotostelium fungivorum]